LIISSVGFGRKQAMHCVASSEFSVSQPRHFQSEFVEIDSFFVEKLNPVEGWVDWNVNPVEGWEDWSDEGWNVNPVDDWGDWNDRGWNVNPLLDGGVKVNPLDFSFSILFFSISFGLFSTFFLFISIW